MFKIATFATGSDPSSWGSLESTLATNNIPIDPEWTYQPYAEVIDALDGSGYGRGYAIATWKWNKLSNPQRTILRGFCAGMSAQVYISTATNEDDSNGDPVFKNFLANIHWTPGQEDKQLRLTLGVDITFTHLIEVT